MRALEELLFRRLASGTAPSASASTWLEAELAACCTPFSDLRFGSAFTSVPRRLGRAALAPTPEELSALQAGGVEQPVAYWTVDELARAMLLARAAAALDPGATLTLFESVYDQGDNRERQAVLRALPLLPRPELFLALAVNSCRTSVLPIFEAIACENIYPAKYFPELNFNQMALKAAFVEVALARIALLSTRKTNELDRMARDYAAEREAAGRPVPRDLHLLLLGA